MLSQCSYWQWGLQNTELGCCAKLRNALCKQETLKFRSTDRNFSNILSNDVHSDLTPQNSSAERLAGNKNMKQRLFLAITKIF
jgi:hypothetical protein